MQVQVKHNGTAITGFVVSYNREHKICTGIGNLTIEIVNTIGREFKPWDTIDIHENGDFKVRYYVSSVTESLPKGVITLDCQDKSKRLVDYFIPDTYIVDYPSYSREWIEKFLAEAGISYTFRTDSPGNLLSNNTQLGLVSAYEQLISLLQMSGWYMFFDGDGTAIIGALDTDLSTIGGSFDKSDILNIKRISDDKMLRNRALVLGAYDPYFMAYATADITVHTKWNYDRRDIRSIVISNSNIPNVNSAVGMANQIIKEFARITVEKHLTVWGARNVTLGQAVRVNSNVWRGRGLITTFGTSMSKQGLVTNLVLDERCPRLFGFFDFGDYVYVGTYGDGIWRKHIKYDHTWQDFSAGLTNLNIVDLHINNGIFASVAASGEAYYSYDAATWNQITIPDLESAIDDEVTGSGIPEMMVYSGIRAKCAIVDKVTGVAKYGVDNLMIVTSGDYFMDNRITSLSGVVGSGIRSWILDVNPYTGQELANYPIHYSGNYEVSVLDIENDGTSDYVSVKLWNRLSIPVAGREYNFGHHFTQPFAYSKDSGGYPVISLDQEYVAMASHSDRTGQNVAGPNALIAIDNSLSDVRHVFAVERRSSTLPYARLRTVLKTESDGDKTVTISSIESASAGPFFLEPGESNQILGIYTADWNTFSIYYVSDSDPSPEFSKVTWTASTDTWGAVSVLGSINIVEPVSVGVAIRSSVVVGNKIHFIFPYVHTPATVGGFYLESSHLEIYTVTIDMVAGTLSQAHAFEYETVADEDGYYAYIPGGSHSSGATATNTGRVVFGIFRNEDTYQILGWAEIYQNHGITYSRELLFYGGEGAISPSIIYEDSDYRFVNGTVNPGLQLTTKKGFIGINGGSTELSFVFNGSTFKTYTSDLPKELDPSKIYPILNGADDYITMESAGNFYKCEAAGMTLGDKIEPPFGYTLIKPFSSTTGSFVPVNYFLMFNTIEGRNELVPYDFSIFHTTLSIYPNSGPTYSTRGMNFGCWFISEPTSFSVPAPLAQIAYVDLGGVMMDTSSYLVLQREGTDYNLIQEGIFPRRIDISNSSPIWTVASGQNSFTSNYIYGDNLIQVLNTSGVMRVDDFRYSYMENALEGTSASGMPVMNVGMFVSGSGIYGADMLTYSGGFQLLYSVPSGYGNRMETSNYGLGGQYIFVTTSGDFPAFYQKDPGGVSFVSYSGLPESRATIIRLDDYI